MTPEDPDIYEILKKFEEWKREEAKTKKPSLLDQIGIKDFQIPEELTQKDRPGEDPNVISKEKIGEYSISIHRIDFEFREQSYFIFIGDKEDPLGEMLREDDFQQAINIYLSVVDYLKRQQKLGK